MEFRFHKTILPNGVRVLVEEMESVRSVSVGVWVDVGSRDETDNDAGISHFIEHMIFKGTKKRSALDIAKAFDQMGGCSNAFTSKENTCFHAKVLDTHLDKVMDLLSDIFLNSSFDSVEVERERQVILQEISMVEDSPDELIHDLFCDFYWPDNSLGRPILGTADTVSLIDSEKLKSYVTEAYTGPQVLIAAAGNLDYREFVAKVQDLFGNVPKEGQFSRERKTPSENQGINFVNKDLEQAHILLGTRGPSSADPKRYAALLFNIILGGSMSSRLFQEIREKRGLAYSVYSFISSFQDTGLLGIYAGTSPNEVATVTGLILNELEKLARWSVDGEELEAARDHLKGGFLLSAESTDSRMSRIAKTEMNLGKYIPYEEVVRAIDEVTPDQIRQMAVESLENGLAMTCLGPVPADEIKSCRQLLEV